LSSVAATCALAGFTLFAAPVPEFQPAADSDAKSEPRDQNAPAAGPVRKASDLIGTKVENLYGQWLGSLQDLALDLHGGQVKYAIISSGGFLGVGKRMRVVPSHLVSTGTTLKN
jgi:sporulation protein YlmC with PRC-barrel domain